MHFVGLGKKLRLKVQKVDFPSDPPINYGMHLIFTEVIIIESIIIYLKQENGEHKYCCIVFSVYI